MRNRCYSRLLLHALQPETLLLNDLCPEMRECICDLLPAGEPLPHKPLLYDDKVELYGAKVPLEKAKVPLYGTPLISPIVSFLPCDAETLDFPQGTDLITSCSTLQWFADTERFFTRCHRFLSDGGILAFSTFGKRNMQEIHTLTGHGLEYFSLEELKALLSSRFEVLYAEERLSPCHSALRSKCCNTSDKPELPGRKRESGRADACKVSARNISGCTARTTAAFR